MKQAWKELDLSDELYAPREEPEQQPEPKPEGSPPARTGGGFFGTLTFQGILCLAVAILMVLLNTFFPSQYRDIDRVLKEQIRAEHGLLEELGGLAERAEEWLGSGADGSAAPDGENSAPAGSDASGGEEEPAASGAGGAPADTAASARAAGTETPLPAGKVCAPLRRLRVTSAFGARTHPVTGEEDFHSGIDLAAEKGEAVYAVCAGTVETAAESDGYGRYLKIRHADGTAGLYAHCSELLAGEGETVAAGQEIARAGSTGMSTGPHLHFGYLVGETFADPAPLLADA